MDEPLGKRIPQQYLDKWDKWDYKVFGPMSLDDSLEVIVFLKNRDGSAQRITLRLMVGEVKVVNQ